MFRCNSVVSVLWQGICRIFSPGSNKSARHPACKKSSWMNLAFAAVIAMTVAACGSGGGGGGGGGSSTGGSSGSTDFVVSGSVTAPGGSVAFLPRKNLFAKLTDILISPAYAAISGLASVPDGTRVDLVRINSAGTVISVLATTTTSGGSYSFNLTRLGLATASDLAAQVTSLSSGVKMRAFVSSDVVNIDPVSETAVRLVLEKTITASLTNFTLQELNDIVAVVNLLATTQPLAAGVDIESTVTAFKSAVAANANITSFITSTSVAGQTSQGPGDIGNYFPFDQGNTWVYQGTEESGGVSTPYTNTRQITGTKLVNGITATVFHETNSGNAGASEDYLFKDSQAITDYGNNVATDFLTPQIAPYREYVFPLNPNVSFAAISKSGLTWPDSQGDGDGRPETASVNATVSVAGFETVTVPAGTYTNAAKIVTNITISVILSGDSSTATVTETATEWYAPGVGLVKSISISQTAGQGAVTTTEQLQRFVPDFSLTAVCTGFSHTCAMTAKGVVYCWGDNTYGQLGNGTTTSSATPTLVSGGLRFVSLEAGYNHTCGLTTGGTAYCWGNNSSGQLGNGTVSSSNTPVGVSGGMTFASVSPGAFHTCGIDISGAAYCWGNNSSGQLGSGTKTNSTTPVAVSGGITFSTVSAGHAHSCGIKTGGNAYCWGNAGSLGNGATTDSVSPVAVSGSFALVALNTSDYHTCGLTTQGTAYCWGYNIDGEVGNGTTSANVSAPVAVSGGLSFLSLKAGSYHTCGIVTGGAAYCWGNNTFGELGNGESGGNATVPIPVYGTLKFGSIDAAGTHACGTTTGGVAYCWGRNFVGELGNGTTLESDFPVAILPP